LKSTALITFSFSFIPRYSFAVAALVTKQALIDSCSGFGFKLLVAVATEVTLAPFVAVAPQGCSPSVIGNLDPCFTMAELVTATTVE
jgi:hypothetical protein